MKTRTYNTSVWEHYDDLETWLDTLSELGVDPEAYSTEERLRERVELLSSARNQYRESNNTDITPAAYQIAATANSVQEAIDAANAAAMASAPEHKARVLEVLDKAIDRAMGRAIAQFRKRGDGALDLLSGPFDVLAHRITSTHQALPDGVVNLDDAARTGMANEWMQLERDLAVWDSVSELIDDWFAGGVLTRVPGSERFNPVDFMIQDIDAYETARAHRGNHRARAAGITAGRPGLRPAEQIERADREPLTDDEVRRRAWEANRRDKAAREALGLK